MPRRNNLKGLPHNITKSFFGTLRYYSRGYMGDWLLNAAKQLKISKASMNVLDGTFSPIELNIKPLVINAKTLKEIIYKELKANGFEPDFIKEARIDFHFPNLHSAAKDFYCFPYMVDKEGRRYEAERIIEEGLEPEFDVFNKLNIYPTRKLSHLLARIKKMFS